MASPYDKIVDLIKQLDLHDDGIVMNQKIKSIEQDFCNVVVDENMLSESMDYINQRVLSDKDASLKFALLFSSRNFDSLAMNDTKVRYKMLNILQTNFLNADQFRRDNKERFYNSITLLGEYYHRVRLADGSPISILGESLLGLLTQEVKKTDEFDVPQKIDIKLAKLILSQITLNGSIMRSTHREEINTLLYYVRRNLIEVPDLKPPIKALLLMTLDLYYSNFSNLGEMLEDMYTKYLVEEEKSAAETQEDTTSTLENGNDGSECEPKKKWSEQVCEDTYETVSDFCDNQSLGERLSTENNVPLKEQPSRSNVSNYKNRHNSGYDEDRHSVRSEGGSIRLYNVSDRLKFNQRGGNQNNWDRGYHTFDNNRRSNSRNRNQYDNNYQNKGNNRNYTKPPRFNNKKNDSWRNSSDITFNRGSSRGPEPNSRSSSRNRNIPRPPRNNYENYNGRSLSPDSSKRGFNRNNNQHHQQQPQQHRQQSRNFGNSRNNRYSSHSSLASDSGTWERRGRHSRGKSEEFYNRDDTRSLNDRDEENWDEENTEIVKNARNTTKYMQYLAKK